MLLSLNWMRDYLVKPEIKIDPKDLADKMTMRGLHVAAIRRPVMSLENVTVAKIVKIEKHPGADRLQITQVIISDAPEAKPLQIVCGAKNISEGDIVPLALAGAILPGDLQIKASTIRGVESAGMLCSGKELGISTDSEGILQLPKHTVLGQPLTSLLGGASDDTLLEFELTPNRGDCLSILGLTREASPILKTKLREPKQIKFRVTPHRTSAIIKVDVDDAVACPRYVARVIDGLKITDSPEWIKQRLQTVGMKPINNIVDVTNFVMIEYGQPLHAFDLRKIQSGGVRVAPCKTRMDFALINGETVLLEEGDIVIWDGERPIALAGIMGGQNTQIEADTTSILLESAAFNASQIRRTSRRLGIISDASKRFEKGSDLAAVLLASDRAAAILRDSMNANVYHPPIDTNEFGAKEHVISIDMRDVRKVTGMLTMTTETAAEHLDSIGIPSHKKSINVLSVRLPTFRQDLKESIDLIEEVARLAGYDSIPETFPISKSMYERVDEGQFDFELRTKDILASLGLRETIHYSFISEESFRRYGLLNESMVRLINPISDEMKVMRTSLLPSLLETYSYNKNRKVTDQRLFEVAHTYSWDPSQETQVKEISYAAALLSGHVTAPDWNSKPQKVDFYFGKGLLELLGSKLTTVVLSYETVKNSTLFHPNRSATIKLGDKEIGHIGEVHPFILQTHLETSEPIVLFELNLEAVREYERTTIKYQTPTKFPPVELDIALMVNRQITSYALLENIKHTGGELLNSISIFDVYEGVNIPNDKKSIAFHLNFLSYEKTLSDVEVNSLKDKIIQALTDKFGAQLRA